MVRKKQLNQYRAILAKIWVRKRETLDQWSYLTFRNFYFSLHQVCLNVDNNVVSNYWRMHSVDDYEVASEGGKTS